MLLSRAIADFTTYLRDVERKSPRTCVGYERDLMLLYHLAERNVTTAFTSELCQRLVAELTNRGREVATVNRHLAAIRKFSRWGLKTGKWTIDPAADLPKLRLPRRLPKPFTRDELAALMRLELPEAQAVVRALLYWTGLRVSTLCELTVGGLDFTPRTLMLPDGKRIEVVGTVRSRGKGGVEVTSYMQAPRKALLFEHVRRGDLRARSLVLARESTVTVEGEAVLHRKPHTMHSLWFMTRQWGRKAGVVGTHPHRFRHSFATEMLRQGYGLETIKVLMGHSSIQTTQMYAEVDNATAASAALSLSPWWEPSTPARVNDEIAALRARLAELEGRRTDANADS